MIRWLFLVAVFVLVSAGQPVLAAGMSLEQIAKTQFVTDAQASPDGSRIAYVLSVPRQPGVDADGPNRTELHVVDANGDSRRFVGEAASVASVRWHPDGDGIAFIGKREGDEHRSLHLIPLDGGEPRRLAKAAADIRAYSFAPDGREVAVLVQAPESADARALREKGFSQKIFEEDWRPVEVWIHGLGDDPAEPRRLELEGSVQGVHWSPGGDRLAVAIAPRQVVDDTLMFVRVHMVARDGRVLGEVDTPGKLGNMAWAPDGRHLALVATEDVHDPREGRLTVVGRDGGTPRNLLPDLEGHVWHVDWSGNDRIVFISYEGVEARVGEIGVDGGSQRDLVAAGGPIWSGLSVARSGDIALVANAPGHPGEVFRLARGQGEPQRLTDSNPWLADVELARQEVVRYAARDGLEIEGILYHPLQRAGNARVPLILAVHGGPEAHYSNGWLTSYNLPAQHAASRGFAVFYPNYRASTGRGVEFSQLNHGRPAKEEFDDLVDGVDHLIETGLVDGDRVGITGGSYGGYASAWGATYYSERFAAAVMNVGLSDKIGMMGTTDIPQELYLVHYLTWPWEDWTMYTEASPIYYANRSRTPTLILHGEADTRVDVTQSKTMYRFLKLAGQAPVRLVLYPGEGHGNVRAASRWDYSLRLMRWMEHYLVGEGGDMPPYEIDYRLQSAED
ncbi:S9 family peptidase [Alkalisalibacterium limincola]|nr:S9 family peptidase [Alkalisalibacterium limincola]